MSVERQGDKALTQYTAFRYEDLVIETSTALAALVERIVATDRIGIDTEADSLHCYREKVCLVQVGLPDEDLLVDPLAKFDLSPLMAALGRTEIILHGADFDLRMLYRLGLDAPSKLFDTVLAARLTGSTKFGYSALVAEHFDVVLAKGSQKANWGRRPMSDKMAEYARNDTHYLLRLAALLEEQLVSLGRHSWLEQSCERAIEAARVVRERDPDTVWRVRGSNVLKARASAVLRALWHWREQEASSADHPPFRIFSNEQLVASAQQLDDGKTVSSASLRGGRKVNFDNAVAEAMKLDPSQYPSKPKTKHRPQRNSAQDKRFAEFKKRRDQIAAKLAIEVDLIAPRAALERISIDAESGLNALLPWQRDLLRAN